MIHRCLFVTPLAVACLFVSQAAYASPVSSLNPSHAIFSKSKTVKFELHNASASPLDLRAGETAIKLKAGETITVSLPPGTRIVTNVATSAHPAGTLILEVAPGFNGTTITLT